VTLLSVNINKIATLRNSRGGNQPDVCEAAKLCIEAGCGGITVHPRPDQRHIRPDDVYALNKFLDDIELNIEGNPWASAQGSYPGFLKIVERVRPTQCTLVPDNETQLTSDHGFNLKNDSNRLKPIIEQLKNLGCRISLFMDAGSPDIEEAADIGADRIEIYTGPYAYAFATDNSQKELDKCIETAEKARKAGLSVNAGHDLNQTNLRMLKQAIPYLAEVSIGHALISEAIYDGLASTVQAYLHLLK